MSNVYKIKNQLIDDTIHWKDALELLTNRQKPWTTKEWKEKRDLLIKNYCESCGSQDGPFVLQHTIQPPKFSDIFSRIKHEYFQRYSEGATFKYKRKITYFDREACPFCSSVNLYFQKTKNIWKCNGKCGRTFEKPEYIQDIDPVQKKDIQEKKRAFYDLLKLEFENKYTDEIGKKAVLESIEWHEEYMSFENTVTFCKKCAFLWDIKGVKLCPVCKEKYCSVHISMCMNCFKNRN
ncbi:MAG: hypothetical protein EOM59_17280 [Clostridia bacterium]|nr:hypothetical protein [Clostridia bacterium]